MPAKIMVADDEELIIQLINLTFRDRAEYEVFFARDAEESLREARRVLPDILLLDISMPRGSGYQVCQELKADPATAGIKIVMLTGLDTAETRESTRRAGADDFFAKPFLPDDLLEKVNQLLAQ